MSLDRIIIQISCDLVKEAMDVKNQVYDQFRMQRRRPTYQDFPAGIVTVTTDALYPRRTTETSRRMKRDTVHEALSELFLNNLGAEAGMTSPVTGHRNPIGQCAEQHATNSWLKKNPLHDFNELKFSICLRPRTLAYLPNCDNCIVLFPQLA